MSTRILAKRGPRIGLTGASAEIDYWITSPAEVDAFLATCMGNVALSSANGYQYRWRIQHPDFPWLWMNEVDVQPWLQEATPGDASTTYPDGYKVTVSFTAKCLNVSADPRCPVPTDWGYNPSYVTKEETGGGEMFSVPQNQVEWEYNLMGTTDYTITSDVNAATFIPQTSHEFTWHNVTSPPWDAILSLLGHVNASAWPSGRPVQYAAETMLYVSYRVSLTFDESPGSIYTLTYSMVEKAIWDPDSNGPGIGGWCGWNHFPRFNALAPYEPLWQKIVRVGNTSQYLYDTGDLSALFVQD